MRRLTPTDFARVVIRDGGTRMTAQDVVWHIAAWKQLTIDRLRGKQDPAGHRITLVARNRMFLADGRRRSLPTTLRAHRQKHHTFRQLLAALDDEFFTGTLRAPDWPRVAVGHSRLHRRRHLERLQEPPARR